MSKELEKYPPLGFKVGDFIRSKSSMNEGRTEVTNVLYYSNCKIVRGYEYVSKNGVFDLSESSYKEMLEEDIKCELTELMIEEELAIQEKEDKVAEEIEVV